MRQLDCCSTIHVRRLAPVGMFDGQLKASPPHLQLGEMEIVGRHSLQVTLRSSFLEELNQLC